MAADEPMLTGQQAADAQTALRRALGLPPEEFPLPAFVGMISDEIEQLRARGDTDDAIAALISETTGIPISSDTIERFYASPEERRHP